MAYTPAPIAQSDFKIDADEWEGGCIDSYSAASYDNAKKAITYDKTKDGTNWYFSAPTKFTGDKFMVYGGKVCFTLTLTPSGGELNQDSSNLMLIDRNGKEIGYDTSQATIDENTYEASIGNGSGWQKRSDDDKWTSASDDDIKQVLGNLKSILIRADCGAKITSVELRDVKLYPKELPGHPMPLEIHTINVSQGDSILIINRDLYELERKIDTWIQAHTGNTKPADSADWMPYAVAKKIDSKGTVKAAVLIDAGDKEYAPSVREYIKNHGVEAGKYTAVVTHYHGDHYDGFIYGKSKKDTTLFKEFPPGKLYDCGADKNRDPFCNKVKSLSKPYEPSMAYGKYLKNIAEKNITRESAKPNSTQISLEDNDCNIKIFLQCVASNGVIWEGKTTKDLKPAPEKTTKDEQNSRSVALILEYGDFRYYLAGDLGGAKTKTSSQIDGEDYGTKQAEGSGGYWNIEIPLVTEGLPNIYKKDDKRSKTVAGHICVLKCSHHGSQWHTNTKLLRTIQPRLCVISSGIRKRFHKHPDQPTLCRVDADDEQESSKNEYSPKWPDTTSGYTGTDGIDNTIKNDATTGPQYYITERAKDGTKYKRKTDFARTYPNGRIVGSVVVRPYMEDVIAVENVKNTNQTANSTIKMQVYGVGTKSKNTTAFTSTVVDPLTSPSYQTDFVGPWIHTCDKH